VVYCSCENVVASVFFCSVFLVTYCDFQFSVCLNICILPIMLYGSECWALSKADVRKIDALDQWCLRRILDIRWRWYHRVSNREVRRMTEQPPLMATVQKRRLVVWPPGQNGRDSWRQEDSDWCSSERLDQASWAPLHLLDGHLKSDLSLHNLTFEDAIELALDKSLWRLLVASGAMHWHGACRVMMMMMMMMSVSLLFQLFLGCSCCE